MTFNEFSAAIKGSMEQYNSAGLIDDLSIYNWMIEGMNEFSTLPTIRIEYIINVRNNKGTLPDGFKSLYSAVKCEPYACTIDEDKPVDVLQDIYHYKVRELKNEDWNFCNPCDIQETDTCVVEKVYFHNGTRGNFYYNNLEPLKLRLTSHTRKSKCDSNCLNFSVNNAQNEISINEKTIYTNFKEGSVFIVYNGYEEDEDGFIMIPESKEDNLFKFLRAYVKREIIRKILENSDNTTNEQFLFSLYDSDVKLYQPKVSGSLKMKKILGGINHYNNKINKEFGVYNFGSFSHNQSNRIDFLVT